MSSAGAPWLKYQQQENPEPVSIGVNHTGPGPWQKYAEQRSEQPSALDQIAASPVGRFVQQNVISPVLNLPAKIGEYQSEFLSAGGALPNPLSEWDKSLAGKMHKVADSEQAAYERSLARNRNTPGYSEARQQADRIASQMNTPGQNATDTLFASMQPAIAGVAGLSGGLDMSNAMADATTERLSDYQQRHPYVSAGLQLAGGFASGQPETAPAAMAANLRNPNLTALGPDVSRATAQKALDYVANISRAAGKDTPADIAAAGAEFAGKPVTAAEAIGRPGIGALSALARRSGATPDALEGMLTERSMSAPSRMLEDFSQAAGIDPATAEGNLKTLVDQGRSQATPLYEQAYAQPPVITDRLAQFAQEPIVQEGMKRGIKIERLKSLAEGRQFDPNAYAITGFNEAGDPIIGGVPTWKTWDAAKLGLDNMLEDYRNPVTGKVSLDKMGDAVNSVRKSMLDELDAVNPHYATARSVAGDYLSAQSAFNRGQKAVFNNNVSESQFGKLVLGMSPAEMEAMKGGTVNQVYNLAQSGRLKPSLLQTPRVRNKLTAILGKDAANDLIAKATAEARLQLAANRMKPGLGSPTAELADAMGEQDAGVNLKGVVSLGKAGVHATKGNGLGALYHLVDAVRHFSPRVATMPVPVRDLAGELLMKSPDELARLLTASAPPNIAHARPVPYGLIGSAFGLPQQGQPGGY